jgi:murein DD-endopeptidase MepM/ murein hydrolase activator NlpD
MKTNRDSFLTGAFNRITAIIVLLTVITTSLPSQSLTGYGDIMPRGFDRGAVDFHFSRADREVTIERWMEEAKTGIAQAQEAWERLAFELYSDPDEAAEAKKIVNEWSKEELEIRFAQWAAKRFFGNDYYLAIMGLSEKIRDDDIKLLFNVDDEGNVMFDEATGDPLIIRPGERDILADLETRREKIITYMEDGFNDYKKSIEALYPELLYYIDEDARASFMEHLDGFAVETGDWLRRDMIELYKREEQLFVARRTGDILSLREKTDSEAASAVSGELILAAEKICGEGIAAIKERIEQARAGTSDIDLAGQEWLLAYQEQFNKGLKAWEEAEERFFVRRIEWEQESGRHYSEGEEAWAAAFNRLSEEKYAWEIESKNLFEEGEKMFENAALTLQNAIKEAKAEFEKDAALRMQSGTERAAAWINTYITSASIAAAAQENVDFWLLDWGEEAKTAPKLLSGQFYQWLNAKIVEDINELQEITSAINEKNELIKELEGENSAELDELKMEIEKLNDKKALLEKRNEAKDELKKWSDIYNKYLEKAVEARNALVNEFSLVMGSGTLADVLSENVTSEDFNLDEYQIELIRAKAVSSYWEKRVNIARAVNEYAALLTAERMTDTEGVKAWENAKAEYDEALAVYEASHKKLSEAAGGITDAKQKLIAASAVLREIDAKLNKLNSEYSALVSIEAAGSSSVALLELIEKYKELLKQNGLYRTKGQGAVYINYLERAQELGFAELLEADGKVLKDIVTGNSSDTKSLSDLYTEYENIWMPESPELVSTDIAAYNIDSQNGYYGIIAYLLYERSLQPAVEENQEDQTEGETENDNGENDGEGAEDNNEDSGVEDTDDGEDSGAEDGSAEDPEDDEKNKSEALMDYDSLILSAANAAKASAKRMYDGRIAALNLLTASSTEEWYRQEYGITPETQITFEHGILSRLYADVQSTMEEFTAAVNLLMNEGYPEYICYILLDDLVAKMDQAQHLLSAYQQTANASTAVIEEKKRLALKNMADFFLSYGITADNGSLPGMKTTVDAVFKKEGDIAENVGVFLAGLNECFSQMPSWIQNEAATWKNAFIEYAAARSIYNNKNSGMLKDNVKSMYIERLGAIGTDETLAAQLASELIYLEYVYTFLSSVDEQKAAINEAASGNEKHWRQYITASFFDSYNKNADENEKLVPGIIGNPESAAEMKAAANYKEGNLADKFEKAEYEAAKFNATIQTSVDFSGEKPNSMVKETVDKYITNTDAEWSEEDIKRTEHIYKDRVNIELSSLNKIESFMAVLGGEIVRMGGAYEKTSAGKDKIKSEMERIAAEISALKQEYEAAVNGYRGAADAFAQKGNAYDGLYAETKDKFQALLDARFEYEKEDAIRRWAATAYLEYDGMDAVLAEQYKNPVDELSYALEKWRRAEVVLGALKDLYDNGETRRPFNNAVYNDLYEQYKISFERLILSIKLKNELDAAIREETAKNEQLYGVYTRNLQTLGRPLSIDKNYLSPGDKAEWGLTDIITVKNGKLAFSYTGSSYTLSGQTAGSVKNLDSYFSAEGKNGNEMYASSEFELALRQLNNYMESEITDESKYRQWSLARDYIIIQLQKKNTDVSILSSFYSRDAGLAGELSDKYATFNGIKYGDISDINISNAGLLMAQKAAWDKMSADEKEYLEFYTILTLTGAGGLNTKGFKYETWITEYTHARNIVKDERSHASDTAFAATAVAATLLVAAGLAAAIPFGLGLGLAGILFAEAAAAGTIAALHYDAENKLSATLGELKKALANYDKIISDAFAGLETTTDSLKISYDKYKASCDRIEKLKGKTTGNTTWAEIELSLKTANVTNSAEIARLKSYWNEMNSDINVKSGDTTEALTQLVQWSRSRREDLKRDLEIEYTNEDAERIEKQKTYRLLAQSYINGEENTAELQAALHGAYGAAAPAIKNHLENIERALVNNAGGVMTSGTSYISEYFSISQELTEIIGRAYQTRYAAELAAREAEWEQDIYDIEQKIKSWREAAGLILAKGRDDWKRGLENMRARYSVWIKDFTEEYLETAAVWDAAYLAGLEDKASWVIETSEAANNASSAAMLETIGAGAAQKARAVDTRGPLALNTVDGILEAEKSLTEILYSAGILNMEYALNAASSSSQTAVSAVRSGVGGVNVWNAGTIELKAAELARDVNEELAAREAKMLAANVRRIALAAVDNLKDYVNEANKGFEENMDDTFIVGGRWSRSGKNYINEILIDASLIEGGKTTKVSVEGYRYYEMEAINLKTDLSEERLSLLESFVIQSVIKDMGEELKCIQEEIFGTEDENNKFKEKSDEEKSNQAQPGKFGKYIGYAPRTKENPDVTPETINENNIFEHKGTGELGRLMSKYIYWKYRESFGFSAISAAMWDMPLWDDNGSYFKAPSIRSIAEIAVQAVSAIGAAALLPFTGGASMLAYAGLSTVVNMTDDAVFAALDVAGGYKDGAEVGVTFAKKTAASFAGGMIGVGFNGVPGLNGAVGLTETLTGGIDNGFLRALAETGMTGAQTFATGTIGGAINSISYTKDGGFEFSADAFISGLDGAWKSALTAQAGTFTSGMLADINLGANMEKVFGFNSGQIAEMEQFNSVTGSLVSSAAEYGLTGNVTFNLAKLSGTTGGGAWSTGILEMNLGEDGFSMGIGSGGTDISMGTIASAARGLGNWDKNIQIEDAAKRNEVEDAATALRVQWGFGDEAALAQLEEILKNETLLRGREDGAGIAETMLEDGRRMVYLDNYASGMSREAKLAMGITLQHEAYRDGIVDNNNAFETLLAAGGHTEIALRMANDPRYGDVVKSIIAGDVNLQYDMAAYMTSWMTGDWNTFGGYVGGAYDSSADLWKLTEDGRLLNDGSGWLKDENGMYINKDGSRSWEITGQTLGAGGIETGLLNILFGGTGNKAYSEFTNEQISIAQALMTQAGIKKVSPPDTDMLNVKWSKENGKQELNMDKVMALTGNTISAQVFARYYDETTNAAIANYNIGEIQKRRTQYDTTIGRYVDLLEAKYSFFLHAGNILAPSNDYYITTYFREKDKPRYKDFDYNHYGLDLSRIDGSEGDPIFAGISGMVASKNWNENNGESLRLEYGYNFEGSFVGTGIYGEYLHMLETPEFELGQYISSTTQIGAIGNSGSSTGPHLHYDIFTNNKKFSETTLSIFYGANATDTSFSSISGYKNVYDPSLYYSNWLKTELLSKNEWLKKYRQ